VTIKTTAEVPSALRSKIIERWRSINKSKAGLDFDLGCLGKDLRARFGGDASGDYQSRKWLCLNLDIGVSTSRKILTAAKASEKFSRAEWEILGGWDVVQFVMHLPAAAHRRLLERAKAFHNLHRRPISYHRAREIAFDLGYRSKVRGRPLRSETEEKLATLRVWIDKLYIEFNNLPDLPERVQTALRGSRVCDPID
jgi:hypothetical protein